MEDKEFREPHLVYRAGLIPYYVNDDESIEMLFMKPSATEFSGDHFQIAKGKIEDEDETALDAAKREGREELGYFYNNALNIVEVGNFMGRTRVFVSKIRNKDMFGLPSDETQDTKWMTLEEFNRDGRTLHVPVVNSCYRVILDLESED